MTKLLVGILKGAVIGGALGYGAHALQQATGFANPWLTYGLIGAFVGLFVGKPLWALIRDKDTTSVIAILKAAFGFGVGCGLYALVSRVWGPTWMISGYNVLDWAPSLGGAIGALYGGFVELDDAIETVPKSPAAPAKPKKKNLPAAERE